MLTFDADSHIYRVNGRKVPSVTGLLKTGGLIDDRWFNDAAAWRGSVVHKCCELDDKGTLNEATVDEQARPYLEAWRAWKRNLGWTPFMIEKPFSNDQFAGTPDRVMLDSRGSACVVDIKTGDVRKEVALQLAGYVKGVKLPMARRFAVRVSDDGRYQMTEFTTESLSTDMAAFEALLTINNWRRINGID